jgi:hypothetical protein
LGLCARVAAQRIETFTINFRMREPVLRRATPL